MKFIRCMKYEFKSTVMQPEFIAVLIIGCLFSLLGLGRPAGFYIPSFKELGPAPEMSSLLFQNVYGRLLFQFLCPIMASIPAACSYYRDKQNHMDALLISACGRVRYIGAKVIMTFLSGFFVAVLPFVINMVFAEFSFARNEMVSVFFPSFYTSLAKFAGQWNIFGELMFSHPVLNYLLHIALIGLWSAGGALITLGISFHFRQHYLFNLILGSVALLIVVMLLKGFGLDSFNPQEAFPLAPDKLAQYVNLLSRNDPHAEDYHDFVTPSGWGAAAVYFLLYGSCGVLTVTHLIKHKDLV